MFIFLFPPYQDNVTSSVPKYVNYTENTTNSMTRVKKWKLVCQFCMLMSGLF